jgi:hypothetical protein
MAISLSVNYLFPAVTLLLRASSIKDNFGDDNAKPFEYDIKKLPWYGGME